MIKIEEDAFIEECSSLRQINFLYQIQKENTMNVHQIVATYP